MATMMMIEDDDGGGNGDDYGNDELLYELLNGRQ